MQPRSARTALRPQSHERRVVLAVTALGRLVDLREKAGVVALVAHAPLAGLDVVLQLLHKLFVFLLQFFPKKKN